MKRITRLTSPGGVRWWLAVALTLLTGSTFAQDQSGEIGARAPAASGGEIGAGVELTLERNSVRVGESVRLRLKIDGTQAAGSPDLSPLQQDFEILGSSKNSQVSIVNGRSSSSTQWIVEIAPVRHGDLVLPPLEIPANDGNTYRSNSVTLRVLPAKPQDQPGAPARALFLEAEVEPTEPYVGSQMLYSVKLFRAVELIDGSLTEPEPQGATTHRLGNYTEYTTTRNGQSYRVIERRYAIFAEKPGELIIEPIVFNGEVSEGRPGSGSLSRMFGRGRPVRLVTEPLRVTVRPRPAAFTGRQWTPAYAFDATEIWSADTQSLTVGEPVTRTVTLKAAGLTGEQLPALDTDTVEGLRAYPDRPIVETDAQRSDALHGSRVERIAYVPSAAGEFELPEMRIEWWDISADTLRETVLPARILNVLPALSGTDFSGAAANAPVGAASQDSPAWPVQTWLTQSLPWQIASAVLAVLWLVTLYAWNRARHSQASNSAGATGSPRLADARRELRFACVANDGPRARRALIAWGRAAWPHDPPRNLAALARRIENQTLTKELAHLDQALYGQRDEATGIGESTHDWTGDRLWPAADAALIAPGKRHSGRTSALPALYPSMANDA